MTVREVVSGLLLLSGSLLLLIAAIGLHRFSDVFARMHASTKAVTAGVALSMAGAAVGLGAPGDVAKLLLVAVFQLLTAPIAAHLLARAAYVGHEMAPEPCLDELAETERRPDQG